MATKKTTNSKTTTSKSAKSKPAKKSAKKTSVKTVVKQKIGKKASPGAVVIKVGAAAPAPEKKPAENKKSKKAAALASEHQQRLNEKIRQLEHLSKEKGYSYAQLAIAWLMHKEDFIVPIPGMMSEEIVRQNFEIPSIVLTPEDMARVDESLSKVTVYGEWDESCIGKLKEVLKEEGYEPGVKSWGHE